MTPGTLRAYGPLLLLLGTFRPAASQERVWIRAEPGTPVVAAEVWIATGPRDEPEGAAGLAHLTARAAVRPTRSMLDSLGAHLFIVSHKDAVAISLIAAPQVWETALRSVLLALFRDPLDPASVEAERSELRAELLARASNPADALLAETDAAVRGADHPWGRPTLGTPASVAALDPEQAATFQRKHFVPADAVLTVTGPVDAAEARSALLADFPAPRWYSPPAEPDRPAREPVRTDYNSITSWISLSYPLPPEADFPALALLADLALERLDFGPNRPSVYNVRTAVNRHAGGGELVLEIVVRPGEVGLWAERMQKVVADFAASPLSAPVFTGALQRHRGKQLRLLDAPEARAAADARAVLLTGHGADFRADLDALSPARLRDAAAGLASPVLVVLGPSPNEPN